MSAMFPSVDFYQIPLAVVGRSQLGDGTRSQNEPKTEAMGHRVISYGKLDTSNTRQSPRSSMGGMFPCINHPQMEGSWHRVSQMIKSLLTFALTRMLRVPPDLCTSTTKAPSLLRHSPGVLGSHWTDRFFKRP